MAVPTSRDVAKLAGVSQSTVSYVLTGKRPISEETRRRVEDAMAQLTFHPNAGARALASQRTRVVGLIAPFGASTHQQGILPFVETIASGVRAHDHDLLLVTADEGAEGMARVVGRRIVDALVVMEVGARDERLAVAAGLGVPVIVIGVPEEPVDLPCVDLDFALGAALAVDELVAAGCTSAALVGYSAMAVERDLNYVGRFIRGAERRAAEVGLPLRVLTRVEPDRAGVEAALDAALGAVPGTAPGAAGGGLPGLVVPNTEALPEVLRALRARGLEPGADVPLVGVCTDAEAEASEPALTNVSLEPRDVSRRAVEALFRLLDPELEPPGTAAAPGAPVELVPPRLTRRDTTRPAGRPAA